MPVFRTRTPIRTCNNVYANYRSYKRHLLIDFYGRCGYCDGSDTWYGGFRSFHIDHFAPKDRFPELETTYSNLIYSCPTCNTAKSNKWPSNDPNQNIVEIEGFLNPVTDDLNESFERDDFGNIIGNTDIARYMITNLNLNLERHSVIWMLTRLEELIEVYQEGLLAGKFLNEIKDNVEKIHYNLLKIYYLYIYRLKELNA